MTTYAYGLQIFEVHPEPLKGPGNHTMALMDSRTMQ